MSLPQALHYEEQYASGIGARVAGRVLQVTERIMQETSSAQPVLVRSISQEVGISTRRRGRRRSRGRRRGRGKGKERKEERRDEKERRKERDQVLGSLQLCWLGLRLQALPIC